VLASASPFVVKSLKELNGIATPNISEATEQLLAIYSTQDCTSPDGLALPFQTHWRWERADGGPTSCPWDIYGLYSWMDIPIRCMHTFPFLRQMVRFETGSNLLSTRSLFILATSRYAAQLINVTGSIAVQ